jgi:hypothetical protein
VGAEHVSLHALEMLGLPTTLEDAGFNRPQKAAALANIIGRMCEPRSELATWNWMKDKSAIGELLELDFESMPLMQCYRGSDRMLKHKEAIEDQILENVQNLFRFTAAVTLCDFTNTYFEGHAAENEQATRGRSNEKRFAWPLITLALQRRTAVQCKEPDKLIVACWSEQRAQKEQQIDDQAKARFEAKISKLHQGLSKKGCTTKTRQSQPTHRAFEATL